MFAVDGLLYKADANGDYSYRGTDPSAYADAFDVEAGDDDLGPLISFLDFVNNSSDADFASGLAARLNVAAFATYLAFEELIDNFDDIDGPGNNSYLWWERGAGAMTVVAWDHNLAFGLRPGAGGGQPGAAGAAGQPGAVPNGAPPDLANPPAGFDGARPPAGGLPQGVPGQGVGAAGKGGRANALVSRFNSLADGTAKVATAKAALKAQLISGGVAGEALRRRVDLIRTKAADLISTEVLTGEQQAVATYLA